MSGVAAGKWPRIALGEIAVKRRGSVDPQKSPNETFELYSIPAYDAGRPEIVTGADIGSSKQLLEPDDVVISRIVPHIQRVWIVGPKRAYRQIGSGEWIAYRSQRLLPQYLRHALLSPAFHASFMSTVAGVGGSLLRARPSAVAEIEISCPPLDEQRRIAAILDKADAIRRKRQQALALADDFLRSAFLDMFGDPVTNPRKLPQAPIKEFGRVVTGNTPSRQREDYYGDAIEWIKSDNLNNPSHWVTKAAEGLSSVGMSVARVVPAGSTLVTCIAGSPSCIGNAGLADRAVAFNQQINAVVPNSGTNPVFFYAQVLFGKKLVQLASTNSMKGMVSKGQFQEILFLKPAKAEQDRFGALFKGFAAWSKQLVEGVAMSSDLFASLSQRAFRGEL
ncbi:restriction endonuclease subunit S [Phaeospirillum tilakii]|uniref:Restriction endonuclease subunit S n=1 Tax=Phaeospirillum tilakii TaxID=741673 RepID=A0ABW5CE26_9PROT